jgi:hypothetical protein
VGASSASAAVRRALGASNPKRGARNSGARGLLSRGMRRRLALPPLVLAAVLAVAVPQAGGEVNPPATVKLVDCSIDQRSGVFHARMHQVDGGDRMWMRFTLLLKGGDGFQPLKAPGLGRWRKSNPAVGTFGYKQVVRGLQAGAAYRARVDFRWYDAEDTLLETARRTSAPCRQFDALPNLTVALVDAEPGRKAGIMRYHVEALNDGVAPALAVPVQLEVDGDVVNTVTIASLLPAERRELILHGPECTRSVEATVDPDGVLVESSEEDNADLIACDDLPNR